jgi:hypothetical protein
MSLSLCTYFFILALSSPWNQMFCFKNSAKHSPTSPFHFISSCDGRTPLTWTKTVSKRKKWSTKSILPLSNALRKMTLKTFQTRLLSAKSKRKSTSQIIHNWSTNSSSERSRSQRSWKSMTSQKETKNWKNTWIKYSRSSKHNPIPSSKAWFSHWNKTLQYWWE